MYFKKSKVPPSGLGPLLLFISQYSQMFYLQRFTRISKDRTIKWNCNKMILIFWLNHTSWRSRSLNIESFYNYYIEIRPIDLRNACTQSREKQNLTCIKMVLKRNGIYTLWISYHSLSSHLWVIKPKSIHIFYNLDILYV